MAEPEDDGKYHCTRDACERKFDTEHGLSVHLARGHQRDDEHDEDAAVRRAERQPVEGVEAEDEAHTRPEAVPESTEVQIPLDLDIDEQEILDAVCFLYECNTGQCAAEAMTMWFDAMRQQPDVMAVVKLRKKVRDA